MAKMVYTVVIEVSSSRVKVTAPAWPGIYFTSDALAEAKPEWKDYLEAFLRLLRKAHKQLPAEPKNFRILSSFIEATYTARSEPAEKDRPRLII
jgi:predicted RNase H-like HicB family nuclease